jgi:DNA-binding CsgD family transcriptional regulator
VSTAVISVLTELSRSAPTVVAVDDLQWLDRPSASALEFALRRTERQRVGFLLSLRTGRTPEPSALTRALADAGGRHVRLGPLSLGALHQLVAAGLGESLPRSSLVRIERASGGNPFFALEIARMLARDGVPPVGEPLPVPSDVRQLVDRRLARLSAETRTALLTVAALARPTTALVDRQALTSAEEAGIVTVDSDGAITFVHPLFASAIYAGVSPGQRAVVHRLLGDLVTDEEERVRHLALGTEGADEAVAAALEAAGDQARRRGASESAAELLEQAMAATPPGHDAEARRRALRAAQHHFRAGDRARARVLADELVASTPRGPLRAEALLLCGQDRHQDDDLAGAVDLFGAGLVDAAGDPALCAPIELHLSFVKVLMGELEAASAHGHAAAGHASRLDDAGLLAEALGVATICDFLAGHGLDEAQIERALQLEDPLRDTFVQFRPTEVAGLLFMWTGRLERAADLMRALRLRMLEQGQDSELPMGTFHLTWLECWRGDLPAAARLADEALAVTEQVPGEAMRALALLARALPRSFAGDVDGARADIAASMEICERIGWRYAIAWGLNILGFVALSTGEVAEVRRILEPMVSLAEDIGIAEPMTAPFLPDAIEALVALGELDRAEALVVPFHDRATELDRVWALATALRCRALVFAARGDLGTANRHLDESLTAHDRLDMPFELGRTLLVQGQVRRRGREKRSAADALTAAADIFDRVGMRLWAEKARAELERVGLRQLGRDELTATEEQVARLAASGLTNRAVADTLFVSPKTVEANLARVYRKLGIRSRAELGGWLEKGHGQT